MQKYPLYIGGRYADSGCEYLQVKSVRINTDAATGNPFVMR